MSASLAIFLLAAMLMCFQSGFFSAVKAYHGTGPTYTVSKMFGCFVYLALCITGLALHGADAYGILLLCGMLLGAAGDYFLAFASRGRLKIGGGCFLAGHVFYIAAFISAAGLRWQPFAAMVIIYALELGLAKLLRFRFHGVRTLVMSYAFIITLMTCTAISTLPSPRVETARALFICCGAVLFLVSDILWAIAHFASGFSRNTLRWLKIFNVVTYFPAQLVLAGSLMAEHII